MKTDLPCPSVASLARLTSRSRAAVRAWLKSPHWPQNIPCQPPWTADEVRAIRGFVDGLKPCPARKPATLKALEDKLLEARIESIRLKTATIRREYMPAREARARARGAVAAVGAALDRLLQVLPGELAAAPDHTWADVLRTRFDAMRAEFSGG